MSRPSERVIDTPVGPARVTIHRPPRSESARGSLILGHGAGGAGPSRDQLALVDLTAQGFVVALVDQPWRVAGRKVAGPPAQLDVAWIAVWEALTGGPRARRLPGPHIGVGRSAGARVAARTCERLRPDALLLVSFPLHPPGRGSPGIRRPARTPELEAATAYATHHPDDPDDPDHPDHPALIVQGRTDAFGTPEQVAAATTIPVRTAAGGHSFAGPATDVREHVAQWLDEHFPR